MKEKNNIVQNVRFFWHNLYLSVENVILGLSTKQRRNKMTVATATYKVGDTYTSQKSKVTGTILEIKPQPNNTVRVKLDVNGNTRWTTWTAQ
jgi:hypothetical protein